MSVVFDGMAESARNGQPRLFSRRSAGRRANAGKTLGNARGTKRRRGGAFGRTAVRRRGRRDRKHMRDGSERNRGHGDKRTAGRAAAILIAGLVVGRVAVIGNRGDMPVNVPVSLPVIMTFHRLGRGLGAGAVRGRNRAGQSPRKDGDECRHEQRAFSKPTKHQDNPSDSPPARWAGIVVSRYGFRKQAGVTLSCSQTRGATLNAKRRDCSEKMVGGTGIEPVTPTMST